MASASRAAHTHEAAGRQSRPRPPALEELGWTPQMIEEASREEARALVVWEDEEGDYEDAPRRRSKSR